MNAMTQTQVEQQRRHLQEAYEDTQEHIADLQARQVSLQRSLTRISVQDRLLNTRAVPTYAPWLPFSGNGSSHK